MGEPEIVQERLEDQLNWYDRKASWNERRFKTFKSCTLVFSVMIPLSAIAASRYAVATAIASAVLGATIAMIEGLQQLNQYHQNWITYRSTAESLKHEKFLFLGSAGPYAGIERPKVLLAERVESLVSQEHSKWTSAQETTAKPKESSKH